MRAQTVRRITFALVLLALLAPSLAQAMPFSWKSADGGGVSQEAGKPVSWIGALWQGLIQLWAGSTATGAGPGLDPNGEPTVPASGSTPPGTGAGPYIDPHGGDGPG